MVTEEQKQALEKQMFKALTALRLEVPESVADGVQTEVMAYVKALQEENLYLGRIVRGDVTPCQHP